MNKYCFCDDRGQKRTKFCPRCGREIHVADVIMCLNNNIDVFKERRE